ncbi:MAG: nuclear transport factor 2 family protein [Candidatus Binataceae bacterium]
METLSAEDRLEIQELLFRFMRSFDEKDWDGMRSCLSEAVDCDYSSFRGTPPGTLTRDEYVDQRKAALSLLKTQHNLSTISIVASAAQAEAACNYAILRFHPEFDGSRNRYLHSYGQYRFAIVRSGEAWSISSIEQILLMSEGNPDLHSGIRK